MSWTVLNDGEDGKTIKQFPFTGESEEFSVKIIDEEVTGLKDDNIDICFSKVMDFCPPRFYRDHLTMILLVLKDLLLIFGNGKLRGCQTTCCISFTVRGSMPDTIVLGIMLIISVFCLTMFVVFTVLK